MPTAPAAEVLPEPLGRGSSLIKPAALQTAATVTLSGGAEPLTGFEVVSQKTEASRDLADPALGLVQAKAELVYDPVDPLERAPKRVPLLRQDHEVVHVPHIGDLSAAAEAVHGLVEGGEHNAGQEGREGAARDQADPSLGAVGEAEGLLGQRALLAGDAQAGQELQQGRVVYALVISGHVKAGHVAEGARQATQGADRALDPPVAFEMSAGGPQLGAQDAVELQLGLLEESPAGRGPAGEEPPLLKPGSFQHEALGRQRSPPSCWGGYEEEVTRSGAPHPALTPSAPASPLASGAKSSMAARSCARKRIGNCFWQM
jgi:hypothetical protein